MSDSRKVGDLQGGEVPLSLSCRRVSHKGLPSNASSLPARYVLPSDFL